MAPLWKSKARSEGSEGSENFQGRHLGGGRIDQKLVAWRCRFTCMAQHIQLPFGRTKMAKIEEGPFQYEKNSKIMILQCET